MFSKKGFTLIELLITVAIIGILVGIVIAVLNPAHFRAKARDGRRKSDLEQIRSALEMYRTDNNTYPGSLSDLSGYLVVPSDPIAGRVYYYSGSTNTYTLCAALEIGGGSVSGCGSCGSATCNYKVTNP